MILQLRRIALWLIVPSLLGLVGGVISGSAPVWQSSAVFLAISLSVGLGAVPYLRGYQFTAWIVAAVVAAMIYPDRFLHLGDLDLRNKWLVLLVVQLVMFGMGTQMSVRDFAGVLRMPHGVIVGIMLQFLIMPFTGYSLARLFAFPPEIAAGIVLIGSCSSGLASNVMCYMANANLALSITLTAIATMLAPLMTPLWMKILAGEFVQIEFLDMMLKIVKIVVVPIGAALLHDYLKQASPSRKQFAMNVADIGVIYLAMTLSHGWEILFPTLSSTANTMVELTAFLFAAIIAAHVYHWVAEQVPSLDSKMPLFSMFGIIYFTAVTTAAGRDNLLQIGLFLFAAAILHNAAGYTFGYWLSRLSGLDKTSARTVALEVGMQNGGMASGLAGAMGKLGTVGLAAAVFSPWMNISGSILANYWKKRPAEEFRNEADRRSLTLDEAPRI